MSTQAQQQANKENAKHSTGPRTDEGKQRSSMNALKHGLCSDDPLIRGEDPEAFDRHYAELLLSLAPTSPLEEDLVEQIIDVTWRLKRCKRLEKAVLNKLYDGAAEQPSNHDKQVDELYGEALAPKGQLTPLDILGRHETRLARRYHQVLKELRTLQKGRRQSALFNGIFAGLSGRPEAEPHGATERAAEAEGENGNPERESENAEPTQSIVTLLESIAPMKNENGEPDPSDLSEAEFYQRYPEQREQDANPEAAK